ncbi:MAG: DUF177 domain-containing protein [Candidatus Omnitrophota bacterium]|jgi:uncharacterized protein
MKLVLSELQEGVPIPVEGSYDAKTIEVEFPDMLYTEPILLAGEAEKSGGMLRLQGVLTTAVRRICGKCLKEKNERLSFEIDWIFDLLGKDTIEPLENVRELLIVEHPLVHLCKANCRGLCPSCGIDLNEGTCNCKKNGYHASPVIIKKEKSKKEQRHGTS